MHENPLISIIIPVYNGADYLREAIDSALAQSYAPCEVLVVNDGSSDNGATEAIARSYGDAIRYFYKENGGVATALNTGLREMRGEYFSWLSHDDVYLPHKLDSQMAFIRHMELEGCSVYGDYDLIDAQGKPLGEARMPVVAPEDMFPHLYNQQCLHGCTLLIPRQALLDLGGFPENKMTTQDYELWLRLCRVTPFVHVPQKLIRARRHNAQGTRTITAHAAEVRDFFADHLPELLAWGRPVSSPLPRERHEEAVLRQAMLCRMKADQMMAGLDVLKMAWARLPGFRPKWEFLRMLAVGMVYYADRHTSHWLNPLWNLLTPRSSQKHPRRNESGLDFTKIFYVNGFGNSESVSGSGSTIFQTRVLRRVLPTLLHEMGIASLLDAPCGDFNWLRHTDLSGIQYTGVDIVPEIIARNQRLYSSAFRSFLTADITRDPLPAQDCALCRDCLPHLPYKTILQAIRNLRKNRIGWLLTTTYPDVNCNTDLDGGVWRPLNLCIPPFNFPDPVHLLDEKNTVGCGSLGRKCLGLWKLAQLEDVCSKVELI